MKKIFLISSLLIIFNCNKEKVFYDFQQDIKGDYSCDVKNITTQIYNFNTTTTTSDSKDTLKASFNGDTLIINQAKLVLREKNDTEKEYFYRDPDNYPNSYLLAKFYVKKHSLYAKSYSNQ